ncbi:MAG: hypothetical protein VB858_02130, partial [Planctomycetaceae bacterium]
SAFHACCRSPGLEMTRGKIRGDVYKLAVRGQSAVDPDRPEVTFQNSRCGLFPLIPLIQNSVSSAEPVR